MTYIDTFFLTKMAKNHTLWGCAYRLCNLYNGLSPESGYSIVSFAAVIRVVTQRFSPTKGVSGGEALRDDPNNGCEGD